jgi:MFS family permease
VSAGLGTDRLWRQPGYARFWAADAVSMFGSHVTTLALQVLAVVTLHASATALGVLNAARWVPYLLFGLLAGVVVDRYRRRPILVGADLGRAALLALIPLLAFVHWLSMPVLVGFVAVFGVLALLYDAAHQSYLPRLVPPTLLTQANARLEQSGAVAQTTGPVLAGGLVKLVGAPLAVLVDAVSYLFSGLVLASLRTAEPASRPAPRRNLRQELREGLSWVYGHPMLAPMAWSTHGWFLCNSMVTTVYVPYALRDLQLGAFGLGVTYAMAGVGAVLGGAVAGWAGRRLGVGPTVILARWSTPVAWLLLPLAPAAGAKAGVWVVLGTAQFLFGLGIGTDSPNELGYRQSVTPDRLQGRMNATIRSLNWGSIAIGAPIGGLLADRLGYRQALWVPVVGLAVAAAALHLSRFRHARYAAEPTTQGDESLPQDQVRADRAEH